MRYELSLFCVAHDRRFGTALLSAIREAGIECEFATALDFANRNYGIVIVLSRNLMTYDPTSLETVVDAAEIAPSLLVTIDDVAIPLAGRERPHIDARNHELSEIVTFIDGYFARVFPLDPEVAWGPRQDCEYRRAAPIFVCHASEDLGDAEWLHARLRHDGFMPWIDSVDLLPGSDWAAAIERTIRASAAVIVCLSQRSVNKFGYIQKEIAFALTVADEAPEGYAFIIPLRLDDCVVPARLRRWQWANGLTDESYSRITAVLDQILSHPRFAASG